MDGQTSALADLGEWWEKRDFLIFFLKWDLDLVGSSPTAGDQGKH